MLLREYIIYDIKPLQSLDSINDVQQFFNQLTYSHNPLKNGDVYMGCISDNDAHCFDSSKKISDYTFVLEGFFVREHAVWLDVLEAFAKNDSNIMPVLSDNNIYVGYYELNDIISLFNDTPFLSEAGGILVIEKGYNDYSFSEVCQIVESNNAKLLGAFISKVEKDVVQITLKISYVGLNDILQSFRRYSYNIVSGHDDDQFLNNLKDRSDYLNKYLNP